MEHPKASLDIISDPICPWCYIGKVRLDAALAQRPDHGIDLIWRTFQLNPDMPREGMERQAYLEQKFGGKAQAKSVYDQVQVATESAGLSIDFSAIKRTPNTFDAHRLIRWSRSTGRQHELVGRLFSLYFEEGADIGDRDFLIETGAGFGMETELLRRLYSDDADRELIQNEEALARQMGVNGVPTFILSERYALVGAQEKDTWLDVIDRINAPIEAES